MPSAIHCAPATAIAAPDRPPSTLRPTSPSSRVRFGVEGSLSMTNSPRAPRVKTRTAPRDPIKASGELPRLSQCRFAAQATTAGAVIVRSPPITPIRNARSSTYERFMCESSAGIDRTSSNVFVPEESSVFQNRFNIDGDIDLVSDDNPAAVHCVLPTDSKVLTIDPGSGYKTRACFRPLVNSIFPPGRFPLPQIAYVQAHWPSDSANCQIAGHGIVMLAFYLYLITLKANLRMVLDIKKVRAPQMVVAFLYSGPNVPGINLHFNRRV